MSAFRKCNSSDRNETHALVCGAGRQRIVHPAGALVKLLGSGRVSGAGAALAGFALVLFGLTTLQQGMGGLAERLHPADLPAVLAGSGASWWVGLLGALAARPEVRQI
jgi:hypothetical protein